MIPLFTAARGSSKLFVFVKIRLLEYENEKNQITRDSGHESIDRNFPFFRSRRVGRKYEHYYDYR